MEYPRDVNGIEVKVGDKIKGEGFLRCNHGYKVDLSPIVTAKIYEDILYFGGLSAKSFRRFWIIT